MFRNTFFISDTHFGHNNILKFEQVFRPFKTIEEHDETLVQNWNSVVKDNDIVYLQGDVTLDKNDFTILQRLKGEIRLIPGNHDTDHKIRSYLEHGVKMKGHGIICSHIPLHPGQLEARFKFNIHGHVHSATLDDPRYINVSCEAIGLTPIHLDDVLKLIKDRGI